LLQKKLRSGITTGTCAAAAAKAAVLAALGEIVTEARVVTPQGTTLVVAVAGAAATASGGEASVIKDAGDDPDITNGILVTASVELLAKPEIIITAGSGVGKVTKPGLSVAVGQPAINPGPRKMITHAVKTVLSQETGAVVTISIPEGETLAKRTLNSALGIVGGLSIIGTTGIVEPMSEEAYKTSLVAQLSVACALGHDKLVFVPGKIGQEIAINVFGLPRQLTVQTSNFIGHMLENAVAYGLSEVLLLGHPGKLVKVAAGIFHTHNRIADARMETLAAYAALLGADTKVVAAIMDCLTTEAVMPIIEKNGLTAIYRLLAERVSSRAVRYVFGELSVGTAIVTLTGELLGMDDRAREIGGKLGWNIK